MIPAREAHAAWVRAPLVPVEEVLGGGALVLAPHADDESLGFGGVIAAAVAAGVRVEVVVLTDGAASHVGSVAWPAERLAKLREAEAEAAVRELGAEGVRFLRAPDAGVPHGGAGFEALVERVVAILRGTGMGTILTTWGSDPHCDHEAAALLARAAGERMGARVWFAPVWGWTLPGDALVLECEAVRVDISAFLPAKRRAIAAHRSQLTDLISDARKAFRLAPEFLALFDRPWEVFLRP